MSLSSRSPFDKAPPSNVEAERTILGAILLNNQTINQSIELLQAHDFYNDSHRRIYTQMLRLVEQRRAIDPITLMDALKQSGDLELIGGGAFIGALIDGVPRFSNIEEYCRIVKGKSVIRAIINSCDDLIAKCYDGDNPDELIAAMASAANTIGARSASSEINTIGDLSYARIKDYEAAAGSDKEQEGLRIGLPKINAVLNGIRKKLHYVFAASNVGKTSFACTLAADIAAHPDNDNPVILFFTLESTKEEVTDRLNAGRARIDSRVMQSGALGAEQWRALGEAQTYFQTRRILIDERPELTVPLMESIAQRVKQQHGRLDLVIVDFMQRMTPHKRISGMSQADAYEQISNATQAAVKRLGCPIIGLVQVDITAIEKRSNKRVLPSDCRGSRAFYIDGRVVLSLYRDAVYNEDAGIEAEVAILKNNEGRSGIVEHCVYRGECSRFEIDSTHYTNKSF